MKRLEPSEYDGVRVSGLSPTLSAGIQLPLASRICLPKLGDLLSRQFGQRDAIGH